MSSLISIILDTNFLLIPGLYGLDIISEIEKIADFNYNLCIIDKSRNEIENIIKNQAGKNRSAAKIAKQIIDKNNIKEIKTISQSDYVDDLILNFSKDKIVATNDKELIRKLKSEGIKIIRMRQKKRLAIEG